MVPYGRIRVFLRVYIWFNRYLQYDFNFIIVKGPVFCSRLSEIYYSIPLKIRENSHRSHTMGFWRFEYGNFLFSSLIFTMVLCLVYGMPYKLHALPGKSIFDCTVRARYYGVITVCYPALNYGTSSCCASGQQQCCCWSLQYCPTTAAESCSTFRLRNPTQHTCRSE